MNGPFSTVNPPHSIKQKQNNVEKTYTEHWHRKSAVFKNMQQVNQLAEFAIIKNLKTDQIA